MFIPTAVRIVMVLNVVDLSNSQYTKLIDSVKPTYHNKDPSYRYRGQQKI